MALSRISFEQISESHIEELIQAQRSESLYIEYKRKTYGGTDSDHAEFLADISSFANAAGGDLIIGVEAAKGLPTAIVPFTADADAEVTRLESIARTGLEPRIPNLKIRQLQLAQGGHAILIRAPRSFLIPHRVNYKGRNRFWARSSAGKFEPNVQELRSLFMDAPQLVERIRAFRGQRLSILSNAMAPPVGATGAAAALTGASPSDNLPVKLVAGTTLVVHLVPFSAFGLVQEVNLSDVWKQGGHIGPLGRSQPTHWEINFDGFLGLSNADPKKPHASYVQIFRNGVIESVSHIESSHNGKNYFHAGRIEKYCVESTFKWAHVLSKCRIEPPCAVLASVLDTRSRVMAPGVPDVDEYKTITSPALHFAEAMVEKLASDVQEQAQLLKKPLIEQIWYTIGLLSVPTFDQKGVWNPAPIS
jgi:hypothetical protein